MDAQKTVNHKPLSAKQLAFCNRVASGESQSAAYLAVYKCRPEVARQGGSQLAARPDVKATIATLREGETARQVLSKLDALEILTQIAVEPDELATSRIAAIKTAADLQQWNAPQQLQIVSLQHVLQSDAGDTGTGWQSIDV